MLLLLGEPLQASSADLLAAISASPVERGAASNLVRQAGMMVAVQVDGKEHEDAAVDVLRTQGARTVEWSEGLWRHGHWVDFDPVETPRRIVAVEPRQRLARRDEP